ncbi:hypothetical protein MLAC_43040 [Mycobacterium lacus]|uniref:ADP ribosyltransferase domain-containing protein n=4 Tax=Mycobacterium lacus TaxID=169765 RepID=A0A7I7NR58_9MYCO|nr:hypothetical protein MLAC_43040 [Mycobacterium lacus]
MAGDDAAGVVFGRAYDRSAAALFEAMVVTRNGLSNLGDGVRMSAHNYSLAEAMSDVGGRAAALPVPPSTGCVAPGWAPSAVGTGGAVPAGWGWVAPYIGMIWPTGDSGKLRAAAAGWRAAGAKFALAEIAGTAGPMGVIRAQQLPEAGLIEAAFSDAYAATTAVVGQCETIAAQLEGYAARIDAVHRAVLDLLARICDPLTGIKEVWEFLTDQDEDEIARIAHDIAAVIEQFRGEADALGAEIAGVVSQAQTTITTMGRHAAREWDQFLHGNPVGLFINFTGQRWKGIGEVAVGLGETALTYNQIRAFLDPVGYARDVGGMARGMAPLVGLGGDDAPSVAESWKELLKGVVHWDDWGRSPGEALGKTEADLAGLFLPGGPLSKLSTKGRDVAEAATGLKEPPVSEPPVNPNPAKPTVPGAIEPKPPATDTQPESGRPAPAPQPKPAADPQPESGRPAPAPANTSLPHSPTESKTPVADKPATGEPTRLPSPAAASAGQPAVSAPAAPSEHLPPAQPQPAEPVPTWASTPPGGSPAEPAPAAPSATAPHPSAPDWAVPGKSVPESATHSEIPQGGATDRHLTEPAPRPEPGEPSGSDGSVITHHGAGDHGADHHGPTDGGDYLNPVVPLTSADLSAFADYTGFGYQDLNSALRDNALDASQQARIDAIHKALEKLPVYEGAVVRGSDLPPEALAQYQPGEVITEDAFLSTTTNPAVAESPTFAGNVEFRIVSKTGRDISSVSVFPGEQEILFPAGTKFYVIDRKVNPSTGRTTIDMMER